MDVSSARGNTVGRLDLPQGGCCAQVGDGRHLEELVEGGQARSLLEELGRSSDGCKKSVLATSPR